MAEIIKGDGHTIGYFYANASPSREQPTAEQPSREGELSDAMGVEWFDGPEPIIHKKRPSPTVGMTLEDRIIHVGGRQNEQGYIEFGSVQAVRALVLQVLRDIDWAEPAQALRCALGAMVTQFGMDEDEWSKPTFDQARRALELAITAAKAPPQQAAQIRELEAVLNSKNARAESGHKESGVAYVTYDGACADLNQFAQYVTQLERAARTILATQERAGKGGEAS